MSLIASASIMHLPETGGEDLANTLEEGEDFGRDQSFVQVLFLERRRKKNKALLQTLGYVPRHLRQNHAPSGEGRRGSVTYSQGGRGLWQGSAIRPSSVRGE